jgi:hypothetical protein
MALDLFEVGGLPVACSHRDESDPINQFEGLVKLLVDLNE